MQNKFLKYNIYIILGISFLIFILIQPYNSYCRSTKSCNPIMLRSLIPAKYGQKKTIFNFDFKSEINQNFQVKFEKTNLSILNGKKIKNYFYIKNLSNQTQEIIFSYEFRPKIIKKFMKNLACPCLSRRTIEPNEEQKFLMHFFIGRDIEHVSEYKNQTPVKIIAKIISHK